MKNTKKRTNHKRSNRHLEPLVIPHAIVYIKKTNMNSYWYAKNIGELRIVIDDPDDGDEYIVMKYIPADRQLHRTGYCLVKNDCQVISRAV
jgi:hypothetical protein